MSAQAQDAKSLDKLFTEAIAKLDNVARDQVTTDYIEEQRKKKIYPFTKFDIGSKYSHSDIGLKFYTRDQQNRMAKLVDELMSHI